MKLTVFTPAYNRGEQLKKLYNSLINQNLDDKYKQDFEWIIIDDGSTDNTSEIVEKLIEQHEININYQYKLNGGKHTAHNYAVDLATGDFFLICDSDDILTQDAIQTVFNSISDIQADEKIAGMVGYRHLYAEDESLGNVQIKFPPNAINVKLNEMFDVTGVFDTTQIYRTNVLRKIKFPEYKGERFFPENWCWRSIDKQYWVRVIPEVLETGKYQMDGYSIGSMSSVAAPNKNPNANADYAYLYYETTHGLIKRIGYYGKYKAFQRHGQQTKHKENLLLNILSAPFQLYFENKYFR